MKNERLGLVVILSSLVVIMLIIGLFFQQEDEIRLTQIRAQGASLVRLLTRIPYDQLVADRNPYGPLQLIKFSQDNPNFAYGAVVDTKGHPIVEVTATGVIVPFAPVSSEPTSWFGERRVAAAKGAESFLEFTAPVLANGERIAHVRVGYTAPRFMGIHQHLPFFAMLALPIFLLSTLFYYLIRREIRPLKQANTYIKTMLQDNPIHEVELKASGEIGEFVGNFNRLIQAAEKRIHDLENQHTGMMTSSKVLSYQKARIETVLESIPEGVIVIDETGTATFANQKLESLLGVAEQSILGHEPHAWCKQPELLEFLAHYKVSTARRNLTGNIEFTPDHAPEKCISVSAYPLFSPKDNARVYGTLIVIKDVTVEVLAKRARSEFVGHVAHELKTPLHVIGMYSEMLLSEEKPSDEIRIEAANVINDETERITSLIRNMLNITKIEMGSISINRQRVKLLDLLKDAYETVTRSAQDKTLEFKLDLPQELSPVYVDKDLIRVAINNLLTNAIKYNKPGGRVVLGVDETSEHIAVYVRDTGIGIDPKDQSSVFEKFFRSEDPGVRDVGGHGLGLALVKEVAELHHGEVRLHSSPDEGSEFTLNLRKTPALLREAV